LIIVVCGFCIAGYLINDSYSDWLDSPIATTITTHPIDDLDFPIVTVCPPKGSHTALNYDLMKADNNSLTHQDREALKQTVYNKVIKPSHEGFLKAMQATANPSNLRQMYEGFQSTPKPGKDGGLEVRMWNINGSIQSPRFGEKYEEEYFKEDRTYNMIIDLPQDITHLVGSGSLVIEVEVDTREEEGWHEEVQLKGELNKRYKLYTENKTWSDAAAHCQGEGGHLASVLTEEEQL
jgi:hypothetical protein